MKSKRKKQNNLKLLGILFFCIVSLASILLVVGLSTTNKAYIENDMEIHQYFSNKNVDSLYLSDIDYIKNQSSAGWDEIRYDQINDGSQISIKIENGAFTFKKGIWAHANSQVTYDISNYDYKYFTAFVGINTTSARGDGVRFSIFTSEDGKTWGDAKYEEVKLPQQVATFVKVDISDANYIRLVANQIANNAADHAVYADAKLVNNTEDSFALNSADYYKEVVKSLYNGQDDVTGELEFNLLKKELVQNVGQYTINSFYNESDDNKAVIDWLMSNQKALRYYILGGKPNGSYYNSLTELSRLYRNYKEDFENTEVTKYGTVLGDLYLRMATSLSLTHSGLVGLWMSASTPENKSDSVRRYAIMKYMHTNELFTGPDGVNYNSWFEDYTVEEMRYVMMNNIDDESILWLNAYTQELIDKEGGARLWPHRYVSYVWPNYANPVYYAEGNKDYFNELFSVKKSDLNTGKEILDADGNPTGRIGMWDVVYTVPGGKDVPEYTLKISRGTDTAKVYKLWMNFRNKFGTGAVCGGISKTGANIRGVHGLPDAVVGQPGHAAHINYFQNSNGEGFWGIDNDVSGWAYTGPGGRSLLGWGNAPYASGYSGTYIPLAQEVVNHNDTYEQSQKLVYLASSYSDLAKKEEIYRKALDVQPLNLDAWYGLILAYNESSNKTEDDYYELAQEIAENLKYYPLPMYQMTNLIKPKLTSIGASYKFTLLQTRILKEASQIPNNSTEVLQPGITKLMSNFLLGQMDTTIATFSFDGEDAGKIVLSSRFDGNGVRWDYAIKGKGENGNWDVSDFKEVSFSADEEHKWQLTPEEIASITSENDIYVHIVGVNYAEENLYKIDISESAGLPSTLFGSDLENRLIGAVDSIEWKYNENDSWKRYGDEEPDLTGDKTVILRMGATGTYLTSKSNVTYTFTEDVVNNKRKYIPVSHLTLEAVSTEATNQQGSAAFALDANYNTRWHSAWNGSDTERYITVKLDEPRNISAVEFVPAGGGNGKIYDGTVWGSMDGENWFVISQKKGLTYTNAANNVAQAIANIKSFDVDVPQRVQYVKIVADRTNGNWITARAFNFYEDTTIKIVANFSFDGANAGEINLVDSEYMNFWKYSVDGGNTWNVTTGNKHKLTRNEISEITSENGIKIKFSEDETEYSIKIKDADLLDLNPYVNDLENRLIGLTNVSNLEWKYSNEDKWTSYSEEEPVVKGDRTLQVRAKAAGITLPSNVLEYQFTEDNQTDKMKYIPIEHISINSFISQSRDSKRPYYAQNVIDGNPNTEWHTDFSVSIAGKEAFISLKLDSPRYVSGLDYLHMDSTKEPYGFMKNGIVYVSEDGENWVEAAVFQEVAQDDTLKHVEFSESIYGQYVKLVIESYDNVFAAASMINLYEDRTKIETVVPTAEIEYSTTQPTNKNVTVKLVNPSTEIKITNNDGKDTYTFTENGEFTFTFEDKEGTVGEVTARVDWIIKTLPTVKVEYNTTQPTNENVTAQISFDRDKTRIVDSEGNTIATLALGEKYTVTFTENGKKEVNFVGPYGNASTTLLNVDWIDKEAPIGIINYSTTNPTNKNVIATIEFNEEDVVITNNNGSNEYTFTENNEFTFEYRDAAGNIGSTKAKVDWIDRRLTTPTITYSTTDLTNDDVEAIITFDKDGVIVEGGNTHIFEENGTYEFKFVGPAGNKGTAIAEVTWIDKKVPVAELSYSATGITNEDISVKVNFDEDDVTITNNDGKDTYIFEENGNFTFEFVDRAGNKGTVTAFVNVIDKIAPTASIRYSITDLTNKDVIATLVNASEEITVINNDGKNSYTFTENGTFEFEIRDAAGNISIIEANVSNIDKEAPTADIRYSTTDLTNGNVTATLVNASEEITIINNNGKDTYTFTENGTFEFEIRDVVGNISKIEAKVSNIDKVAPTAKVKYSNIKPTNKNVVVTLVDESEEITITNNNGKNTYTFTENGTFTFEFEDKAGNKGNATAVVNNINKDIAEATIIYSPENNGKVNTDVIATVTFDKEDVIITNNSGKNTYTFKENGEFTFEYTDKSGNDGVVTAEVTWIDKTLPTAELEFSTKEATNEDVILTLKPSESVIVANKNLEYTENEDGTYEFTFKENGSYIIKLLDEAGNCGQVIVEINWIDKVAPTAKVEYSTTELTNKDVVATLKDFSEEVTILNNNGSDKYTFTENGTFTFEIKDKAGNISKIVAKVDNINKVAPTAKVEYSTTELTNKDVVVILKDYSDDVTILNNGGKNTYTFTENGEFIFEIQDKAGNISKIKAIVSNIDKVAPTAKVEYSTIKLINKDVLVTLKDFSEDVTILNNDGKTTYTFTKNGEFVFEIQDKAGNISKIKAIVNNIDKKPPVGTITYDVTNATNGNVIATIKFNKINVTITNNGGLNTYTFTENGEFVFEFVDEAGNIGKVLSKVNWIIKEDKKDDNSSDNKEENNSNNNTNSNINNNTNINKPDNSNNDKVDDKSEDHINTEKPNSNEETEEKHSSYINYIIAGIVSLIVLVILLVGRKSNKE